MNKHAREAYDIWFWEFRYRRKYYRRSIKTQTTKFRTGKRNYPMKRGGMNFRQR